MQADFITLTRSEADLALVALQHRSSVLQLRANSGDKQAGNILIHYQTLAAKLRHALSQQPQENTNGTLQNVGA